MELRNFIEVAEKKAGTQKELANYLEITASYIRNIKACKSGLPDALCIKLADYIGADRLEVIAASNLVTEKDEKKRKLFESCFQKVASVAAVAIITFILSLPLQAPVHAASTQSLYNNTNYTQLLYTFCGIVL